MKWLKKKLFSWRLIKKNKDPNPTVQEQTVSLPSDKRAERVVVEEKTAKFPSEGVGIHFKNRDKFQMKNLNRELSSLTTEEQLINKDLNKDDENEKNGNNRKDNAQDSNHRADIVFRRLDRKRKNKICLGDILQAFRTDRVAAKLIGLAHKVQDNQQIHEEKKLVEAFQKVGVKEPSDMVNREKFRVAVDLLCFTSQHSSQQSPSANVEETEKEINLNVQAPTHAPKIEKTTSINLEGNEKKQSIVGLEIFL